MINVIRMQLKTQVSSKLAFVSLIKECTDLGLRDAKFIADDLQDNLNKGVRTYKEIHLKGGIDDFGSSYIRTFQKGISDLGIDAFVTGGLSWERNFKMLSIGLGEDSDYSNFIIEYVNSIDRVHGQEVIGFMVEKLSKKDLEEIFSKISKEIKL